MEEINDATLGISRQHIDWLEGLFLFGSPCEIRDFTKWCASQWACTVSALSNTNKEQRLGWARFGIDAMACLLSYRFECEDQRWFLRRQLLSCHSLCFLEGRELIILIRVYELNLDKPASSKVLKHVSFRMRHLLSQSVSQFRHVIWSRVHVRSTRIAEVVRCLPFTNRRLRRSHVG